MNARSIYHHWIKTYGGDAIWHEEEIVRDINRLLGERVSECERGMLKEIERIAQKYYDLKKIGDDMADDIGVNRESKKAWRNKTKNKKRRSNEK